MIKSFPIDFIRQAFEQTLLIEHNKNEKLYGGKNQVSLFSFYEQLKTQDQVDRFVKTYRDLDEQQNRMNLIMNGVLLAPENPTITNIYSSTIIPMSWTCSFRTTIGDRDNATITINNLIEKLKGRKVDVAELFTQDELGGSIGLPFVVGTIGQNDGAPQLKDGDYIGEINNAQDKNEILADLASKGIVLEDITKEYFVYCKNNGQLKVARLYFYGPQGIWAYQIIEDDGTYDNVVFPPEHTSFEKWKMSLSFDAIRCDEPRNLNGEEYCELSFSGSATIVSKGVRLGNDLIKIGIKKTKVESDNPTTFSNAITWLEPMELPSGNNIDSQLNQLLSKKFLSTAHANSVTPAIQYTFILDMDIELIKVWFDYARYGKWSLSGTNDNTKVSPNLEYTISEIWSSWGDFENKEYGGKIVENIDIENTESDTMTISVCMQVVGN